MEKTRMPSTTIDLKRWLSGFVSAVAAVVLALAILGSPAFAQSAASSAAAPAASVGPDSANDAASAAAGRVEPGQPAPVAVAEGSTGDTAAGAAAYTPMKPTPGIGMPVQGGLDIQEQFSPTGRFAFKLHVALLWVMGIISAFVLGLLVYVMWRFRAKANPVPSRTTHNTLLEVAWTIVPALILIGIAIPSISLLSQQYRTPPADAVTVKVTGYQWYWGYTYPDHGGFEVISNMLPEDEAVKRGEPGQLAVDNRMVVPAGVPLRIQVTAADVIHAFAVPSLWFKLDAVPGRLNERVLLIERPGVYYGQCSELCGVRHAYMPIAVEALPMPQFLAWVRAQGGTVPGEGEPAAAPAAAPLQDPESAVPNAAGAGAPPTAVTSPGPAPAPAT
jgi:cytochrome c oxidase subunit II